MTIPNACPECGSQLEVVEASKPVPFHPGHHIVGQPLEMRDIATVIAACSGCEFIYELTPDEQTLFHATKGGQS